jgi:hypothetical protein
METDRCKGELENIKHKQQEKLFQKENEVMRKENTVRKI